MIALVLSLLVAVSLSYGVDSLALARHSQDWNGALSAADAGVDNFLYRLNANEDHSYTYAQSIQNQIPAGCPRADGDTAVAVCGWAPLPGGTDGAAYQYSIPAGGLTATTISVNVTGSVRAVKRAINITLSRVSYLNYAYFSDHETQDPANYVAPEYIGNAPDGEPWQQAAYKYCGAYSWVADPNPPAPPPGMPNPSGQPRLTYSQDKASPNNICVDTEWTSGDNFQGPVRTNDILTMNGNPTFNSPVTVGRPQNPTGPKGNNNWWNNYWFDAQNAFGNGQSFPNFKQGITPGQPLALPPYNPDLVQWGTTTNGGCTYQGITRVDFNGATMTVYSPNTANDPTHGCYSDGATPMQVPQSGVLYVAAYPNDQAHPCQGGINGKTLNGLILQNDYHVQKDGAYECHSADVFVGGTFSGNMTIGSDDLVVVDKNVTYQSDQNGAPNPNNTTDVLGLEPVNGIEVYHPTSCSTWTGNQPQPCTSQTNTNNLLPTPVNHIDAAMLTFNHTFHAENYWFGPSLGTAMTVYGTIAQRYRGRMAGTPEKGDNAGYGKNYNWDPRLAFLTPSHFLPPGVVAWGETGWSEIKPS
jgi:hypothetical protein